MAWLYQRPDSSEWWVGYRKHGAQVRKSTGQTDKESAKRELAKIEAMLALDRANGLTLEVFEQITGRSLPSMTLKAGLKDWMSEASGATGKRTVEKYQLISGDISDFFKANDQGPLLRDITTEELQRYLGERRAVVTACTANMARKCLAIFFKRSKARGYVRENPMEGIPMFKAGPKEARARRPFTQAEISTLYRQAPDDFWRYMVLGGFFTGLRLGDLVTMPIGAFDSKAGTINILVRKTNTTMRIPVAPPLFEMLSKLKQERKGAEPTAPLWPEHAQRYEENGSGWFGQRFYDLILVKAGLVKSRPHRKGKKSVREKRTVNEVSFHCLRHSYVSTLAALGQNQQIVKALAGHSGDDINDLYTKLPENVLRGAIALLPDVTKPEVAK